MFDIDGMSGLVAMLAVVLIFGTPISIVIVILIHKSRRTQRIHQTKVALAEKGLPMPPRRTLAMVRGHSVSLNSNGALT